MLCGRHEVTGSGSDRSTQGPWLECAITGTSTPQHSRLTLGRPPLQGICPNYPTRTTRTTLIQSNTSPPHIYPKNASFSPPSLSETVPLIRNRPSASLKHDALLVKLPQARKSQQKEAVRLTVSMTLQAHCGSVLLRFGDQTFFSAVACVAPWSIFDFSAIKCSHLIGRQNPPPYASLTIRLKCGDLQRGFWGP